MHAGCLPIPFIHNTTAKTNMNADFSIFSPAEVFFGSAMEKVLL